MLYHTGARNFECKICGNKFFQMEHLKRHMQSIHNVISCDSTNTTTSSKSQVKTKKLLKTPKDSKEKIPPVMAPTTVTDIDISNSNLDDNIILVENNTVNQLLLEQNNSHPALLTQHNLDQHHSNQDSSDCYKITSKCVFKCQKCEFSTNKLFTLNDHVISKHVERVNYTNEMNSNSELNGDEATELTDEFTDDLDDLDENNSQECDLSNLNGNDLNFSCAFCNFKSTKKNALKVKFCFLFFFTLILDFTKNNLENKT
jgi:hypothetical protein